MSGAAHRVAPALCSGRWTSPWGATLHVLAGPWQAQRNRASMWVWGWVIALSAALPIALWWRAPAPEAGKLFKIGLCWAAQIPLASAWAMLVSNLLQQNHPALARQVPGHVAALRRALLLAAVLLSAVGGALLGVVTGHTFASMVALAAVFTAFAVGMRQWWLLPLLAVSATVWQSLPKPTDPDDVRRVVVAAWTAAPSSLRALALVCVAAALMLLLRSVVRSGDAFHFDQQERLRARLRWWGVAGASVPVDAHQHSPVRPGRELPSLYSAALRTLSARPDRFVAARLGLGLGPSLHWCTLLALLCMGVGGYVAVAAVLDWIWPHATMVAYFSHSAGTVVALLLLMHWQRAAHALYATRREQMLLRLLPGAALADQGSARMVWRWVRGQWIFGAAVVGLLLWAQTSIANFQDGAFPSQVAAIWIALNAPALLLLWRDWSRSTTSPDDLAMALTLYAVAMLAVANVWVLGLAWGLMPLGPAVSALALGFWLWRRREAVHATARARTSRAA